MTDSSQQIHRTLTSQISDGYHTFAELYEHRHALTLALMKAMPRHFWFSRKHADGELCFGDGEWFIVGAELPDSGEITYHLPMRLWTLAQMTGAAELERGHPWDGHTAPDVVARLKTWASCSALARWGRPAPVPVSERLPEPEDCDAEGRCWWSAPETNTKCAVWCFGPKYPPSMFGAISWLPHHALPVPLP